MMRIGNQEEDMLWYLRFEGAGIDEEGRSGLVYTDTEDEMDFEGDCELETSLREDFSEVLGFERVVHTQPVHLLEMHNLKTLQEVYEENEASFGEAKFREECKSSSIVNTRKSSVFSSTQSIEALVRDNEVEEEEEMDGFFYGKNVVGESTCEDVIDLSMKSTSLLNSTNMAFVVGHDKRAEVGERVNMSFDAQVKGTTAMNDFVYTLTNKLLPYFGYFLADSKDLDYFDKIRYQEIDYKFSKTYF